MDDNDQLNVDSLDMNDINQVADTPSPYCDFVSIEGGRRLVATQTHKAKMESNFWE